MRVSFAGFILWEVNFKVPNDRAEAKVKEVEEKEEPFELVELAVDCEVVTFLDWRRSWRAFASAFSWVRTKLARFYHKIKHHLDQPKEHGYRRRPPKKMRALAITGARKWGQRLTLMKSCPSSVFNFSMIGEESSKARIQPDEL